MDSIEKFEAPVAPNTRTDYGIHWGKDAEGNPGFLYEKEVITNSTWVITCDREAPSLLVIADNGTATGISQNQQSTVVYVEGGTAGLWYKLTNTIQTLASDGTIRKETKTGLVYCFEK
jgi:hypothetical protein